MEPSTGQGFAIKQGGSAHVDGSCYELPFIRMVGLCPGMFHSAKWGFGRGGGSRLGTVRMDTLTCHHTPKPDTTDDLLDHKPDAHISIYGCPAAPQLQQSCPSCQHRSLPHSRSRLVRSASISHPDPCEPEYPEREFHHSLERWCWW